LIAQHPIEPRDAARLLVVDRHSGSLTHTTFGEITCLLRTGDLLVANKTRVIPARLQAFKVPSGGKVELLLLARRDSLRWELLVKGRQVRPGQRLALVTPSDVPATEGVVEEETPSGGRLVRFARQLEEVLTSAGRVPLPPYIHVPLADPERYQTVYAQEAGSVAAPTAGLHFTPELLARLRAQGVGWDTLTLHIGLDTFRPVHEEQLELHQIHSEYAHLSAETVAHIEQVKRAGGRVFAVGTTSVRVLESAWQAGRLQPYDGFTSLFLYPSVPLNVIDGLITNFHLPRSSLLMLVSAFAGVELIRRAYQEAIRERYRFYSFGDAMIIL